jgi:hypothetical protein
VPETVKQCRLFEYIPGHEAQVMRDWVGLALTDRDLLCTCVLLSACRHILRSNPNLSLAQTVLQYKQRGLRSLRNAISGALPTVSPLTIAHACAMALDEVGF